MARYRKEDLECQVKLREQFLGKCWISDQQGTLSTEDETLRPTAARHIAEYTKVIKDIGKFMRWVRRAQGHGWHDGRWNGRGSSCFHITNMRRQLIHDCCKIDAAELIRDRGYTILHYIDRN